MSPEVGKGSGEGGKAARQQPKPSGSVEPRGCRATNPNMSVGNVHECHGMGPAVVGRWRWDPSQSPGVLRLCLFIMGRERQVLCALSPALFEASNHEWDWKG